MLRKCIWLGIALLLCVCLVQGGLLIWRPHVLRQVESSMLSAAKSRPDVPSDYGARYRVQQCRSGVNTLNVYTVDAGPDTSALLIYSGNGQTVGDWSAVQAYLADQGLSTMVFDYAGTGKSTGRISYASMDQDAVAAWVCFRKSFGPDRALFAAGYSLGTAVLMNNAARFPVRPKAMVLYGAFSSVKAMLAYFNAPESWQVLMPDIWDSARAAIELRHVPLFVETGADDSHVPPEMGRKIAIAANGQFHMVWGARHKSIVEDLVLAWSPILDYLDRQLVAQKWKGRMPGDTNLTQVPPAGSPQ